MITRDPCEEDMRLREKANIETALKRSDWQIYGPGSAVELLGLKPTTLLSRIKKDGDSKDPLDLGHELGFQWE